MTETKHKLIFGDSRRMGGIRKKSVNLVVTSPPYPMIKMWDAMFSGQNKDIGHALKENGDLCFELMHKELDKVWEECHRVLKSGGIACINIGDATRSVNRSFKLYPNHARILSRCTEIGFQVLPPILWRKQSNKPNKFMGSGMLPAGAYVTLEHEYILILRKGLKREFTTEEEKQNRRESAFFWEERNAWFSDLWTDLRGDTQKLNDEQLRERSAAYPFELVYRLVNMFSIQGDTILDPFLGTGTTTIGAIASGRNSIGIEIDSSFKSLIESRIMNSAELSRGYVERRIKKHLEFVRNREDEKGKWKYTNKYYNFPVMTRQEVYLKIPVLKTIRKENENTFVAQYANSQSAYRS